MIQFQSTMENGSLENLDMFKFVYFQGIETLCIVTLGSDEAPYCGHLSCVLRTSAHSIVYDPTAKVAAP